MIIRSSRHRKSSAVQVKKLRKKIRPKSAKRNVSFQNVGQISNKAVRNVIRNREYQNRSFSGETENRTFAACNLKMSNAAQKMATDAASNETMGKIANGLYDTRGVKKIRWVSLILDRYKQTKNVHQRQRIRQYHLPKPPEKLLFDCRYS